MKKDAPNPVIVIAPDKSCLGHDGMITSGTEVILLADPLMYIKMQKVLEVWGKKEMGIPGKRGIIEG